MPNRAYLSLGSNIDPERNLPAAVLELAKFGGIVKTSQVWESAPLGGKGGHFLNAAILLETELSAENICAEVVAAVETKLGRVRDPNDKNAPRTIDIDLSLFNHETLSVGHRRIPDPDILTRAFVAVPLSELEPDYVLDGRTLAEIAGALAKKNPLTLRKNVSLI